MPRGSKRSYTSKQRRRASHIEESGKSRGMSNERAQQMAYATVNKEEGGGKKNGGRGRKVNRAASARGGRKSGGGRKGGSAGRKRSSSSSRSSR